MFILRNFSSFRYFQTFSSKIASTMKLSDDQMSQVLKPGVLALSSLFKKHDHEIRIAGGAVRDLLRGIIPHDLDFATTATPQQMKDMFQAEDIRMINALGEKHGTITARIEEENFECTTLRIDVLTDGRRAEVQFTTDWYLDSNRRDLTINSMFLGLDGTVYDYFNGVEHLKERKVEFVGDACVRIQEDYLRILRYFRFYGRISDSHDTHSPTVLEAIKSNAEGLKQISGERIWMELQKIVVGNFGAYLLKSLLDCDTASYIGLPEDFDSDNCIRLWETWEKDGIDHKTLNPMTVLAGGFKHEDEAYEFILRVKCSKKDRETLVFILQNKDIFSQETSIKDLQDMLVDAVIGSKNPEIIARTKIYELLKFKCMTALLTEIKDWKIPAFPIKGGMLVSKLKKKQNTKKLVSALLDKWKRSNFRDDSETLLSYADQIAPQFDT